MYDKFVLPIDESIFESEEEWHRHPDPSFPVEVNDSGTHLYNYKKGRFVTIRHYKWKVSRWEEFRVHFASREHNFCRIAVECFIGRKLMKRETVDHANNDRRDNSYKNLSPRFMLFQVNNRRQFRLGQDSNHSGVSFCEVGKFPAHYVANSRMYTPDEKTVSKTFRKHFWIHHYGSKEEAYQAAVEWKDRTTLRQGMVFV